MNNIPELSVLLPFELKNENQGRKKNWYTPAKERKSFESRLRRLDMVREPFDKPVRLELTRILGKGQKLWDSDSILRGNSKELIDSLVAVGWFHDDKPKWITHTFGFQDANQRESGPAILVEVFDVNAANLS